MFPRVKPRWQRYVNAIRAKPSRGILLGTPTVKEVAATWIAALIGIGTISSLHYYLEFFVERSIPLVVASFAATAVLIYCTIESPLAQPRCVFGGHVVSALVGVSVQKIMVAFADATDTDVLHWRSAGCGVAVATAIVGMMLTKTTHPPGGATALAFIAGTKDIWDLGYLYVLTPIAFGAAVLLIVAALVNNLFGRPYPQYWLYPTSPREQSWESTGLPPLDEKDHHIYPPHQHRLSMVSTNRREESTIPGPVSLSPSPPPPAPLRGESLDESTLHKIEAFLEHEAAIGVGSERTGGPHGGAMGNAAATLEAYRERRMSDNHPASI
ncbi:hypothetical protein HDU87_007694 [Geranomyces variabilis]|uniref:HPP transmembrane region domain-containing protein n=1 Tax=Geranomyces variabilis TaxID=109894 RepID=A0AAD5TJ91_9FUNG|nr:hypothetical protein HDU87_007694 [Geranomyces variabilis]